MKANELMLGDWVRVKGASPAQVVMIDQYDIVTSLSEHWINESNLEAVEITPEILEANGFEKHKEHWDENPFYLRWFSEIDGLDIHFSFFLDYATGTKFLFFQNEGLPKPVRFVHQLQHALRMVGLDDLADNFIIEKGGTQ